MDEIRMTVTVEARDTSPYRFVALAEAKFEIAGDARSLMDLSLGPSLNQTFHSVLARAIRKKAEEAEDGEADSAD